MPPLEPPEPKAQRLLRLIVEAVLRHDIRPDIPSTFPSYSQVLAWLGEPKPGFMSGTRLNKLGLESLNQWTIRHAELPKVTALIVTKGTQEPGAGFALSHGHGDDPDWRTWWLSEARRAVEYDWTPFLRADTKYVPAPRAPETAKVREDDDSEVLIIPYPPPARIGDSGITVAEILRWLAAGASEMQIMRSHPGVEQRHIRASLAYAADREAMAGKTRPSFTSRWRGKFTLPEPDLEDARLSHLLARYEKGGK